MSSNGKKFFGDIEYCAEVRLSMSGKATSNSRVYSSISTGNGKGMSGQFEKKGLHVFEFSVKSGW
jgi:hypothetical protein